ncbi:MAG: hypothetical protein ACAH80_13485 [Alphaproteobacteria bacterium]
MGAFDKIKSMFTSAKDEGCEASASKMFDANSHKMVTLMRRAGEDDQRIAEAVKEGKEKYVSNVCTKPGGGMKP